MAHTGAGGRTYRLAFYVIVGCVVLAGCGSAVSAALFYAFGGSGWAPATFSALSVTMSALTVVFAVHVRAQMRTVQNQCSHDNNRWQPHQHDEPVGR